MYKKYKLQSDIIAGFQSQTKEDVKDAMSDFDDYLDLIEE